MTSTRLHSHAGRRCYFLLEGGRLRPQREYEPTDPSKIVKHLTAEDLRDQFGTVIEARVAPMTDDVKVKLDDGRKVITQKQFLTKGD